MEDGIIESKYSYVVPNLTKYDLWELYEVTDHLLLVPKRHVIHLNELDDKEKLEFINTLSKYEADGYSIYSRSSGSNTRSVDHLHTHLIKTSNKQLRLILFTTKPYFLLGF